MADHLIAKALRMSTSPRAGAPWRLDTHGPQLSGWPRLGSLDPAVTSNTPLPLSRKTTRSKTMSGSACRMPKPPVRTRGSDGGAPTGMSSSWRLSTSTSASRRGTPPHGPRSSAHARHSAGHSAGLSSSGAPAVWSRRTVLVALYFPSAQSLPRPARLFVSNGYRRPTAAAKSNR